MRCSGEGLGVEMQGTRLKFTAISKVLVSQAVRAHGIREFAGWSHAATRFSACQNEGSVR